MNNMVDFSRRLKEEREKAHLTQAQLAQKVGVSSQTISAYEKTGEKGKTPTLDNAAAIASALGVSLDYLVGQCDDAQEQVELKNISSVLRYLKVVTNYFECFLGTKIIPLPEDECYPDFDSCDEYGNPDIVKDELATTLTIRNSVLSYFVERSKKLYRLVQDGTISKDMYKTWEAAELQKLDNDFPLTPISKKGDFK